jgi:RNA polymerase sigma-70 factor (sigma-E family)
MAGVSTGGERVRAAAADRTPDAGSFAELFAQHYLPALRLAALLEGDQTRAEDAVCDAFARVYGRLRRGGIDDPSAYLRRAVVNAVRGSWRRRQVERRHTNAFVSDVARGAFESGVVERDAMWRALAQIPPGQRRVVVLRYYEDLSEAEVARLLRVKVGTVKSQAAKGLAALQTILEVRDG